MDTLLFKIGNEDIEIEDIYRFPLSISYHLENIADFQQKRSSEAFDLTIPATKKNSVAANMFHDHRIEDMSNNATYKNPQSCVIRANGVELLVGKALLQSAKHTDKPESYDFNCYGNNGDWILGLKDKTLWDFVSPNTHTFTKANVEASWMYDGTDSTKDYVYAPVRYRQPFDDADTKVTMYQMKPALFIYWMIYRAFTSIGYKINSTFMNLPYFRRMVLPWVWGNFLRIDSKQLDVLKFRASGLPVLTAGFNGHFAQAYGGVGNMFGSEVIRHGFGNVSAEWNMSNDNSLGMYDNDNAYQDFTAGPFNGAMLWEYSNTQYAKFGALTVGFHLQLALGFDISFGSSIDIVLEVYKAGVLYTTIPIDSQTAPALSNIQRAANGTPYDIFFEVEGLVGTNGVACYIRYNFTKSVFGDVFVEATAAENNVVKKSIFEIAYFKKPLGGNVDFSLYDRLKEYKFLDLMRGLCDAFDIIPQTDSTKREVILEPAHSYIVDDTIGTVYSGYFKTDRLNYADKHDLSKESQVILFNDLERQQIFKFKSDNNDGGANKYIGRNSVEPAASKYLLSDRFKTGDKPIINRFFSPVMHMLAQQWKDITGVVPQLIAMVPENIANTSADENELSFEPKLAYYKGMVDKATNGGWNWDGDLTKDLPLMFAVNYKAGGHNDPILTYNDQNINGVLGRGLMKRFFLPRLAIIEHGKLYFTWLNLEMGDITNWTHRERIILADAAWLLYDIDKYNPFNRESCQCTFWKYFPVSNTNISNCFPSQTSVITQPASLGSNDMRYAPLILLNTDIPQ